MWSFPFSSQHRDLMGSPKYLLTIKTALEMVVLVQSHLQYVYSAATNS